MLFNLDLSKQAQKVVFSRKTNKISHPTTTFNTVPVASTSCQKRLGLYLDEKSNFSQHVNINISKANKGLKKNNNFMAPFYGWGSTASRLEPL